MTTYGLTSTGFVPKPFAVCKDEIETSLKSVFGESIDLSAQSVFGQLTGIIAERESDLWDVAQDVYEAGNPSNVTGAAQDSLCALTGTVRDPATHSTVSLRLGGTAGTLVPEGKQASVTSTGVKFETLADATIIAVGTFTYVDVDAQAVETGPLPALAGSITTIETPVSGWDTVTNLLDAEVGADQETDADLRLRREVELRHAGGGALEAIRSRVLEVSGIQQCAVFENTTMVTDGDGLPAKSIEVVVHGTYDADSVREAIFGTAADPRGKAAGIATYGTTSGTLTDSQGQNHTVRFSDATEVPVYMILNVSYDADTFPLDGTTQIQDAVLAFGQDLKMGRDIVSRAISAQAFSVTGVLDCEALISTTNPPVATTTIAIGIRQLGTFDSSRMTINITPVEP